MIKDKFGRELKVGDTVSINATVQEILATATDTSVRVEIDRHVKAGTGHWSIWVRSEICRLMAAQAPSQHEAQASALESRLEFFLGALVEAFNSRGNRVEQSLHNLGLALHAILDLLRDPSKGFEARGSQLLKQLEELTAFASVTQSLSMKDSEKACQLLDEIKYNQVTQENRLSEIRDLLGSLEEIKGNQVDQETYLEQIRDHLGDLTRRPG